MHVARAAEVVYRVFDGGAVLVGAGTAEACRLNRAATLLWLELDRPRSVDELAGTLAARFGIELATARRDAQALVDDLVARGFAISAAGAASAAPA